MDDFSVPHLTFQNLHDTKGSAALLQVIDKARHCGAVVISNVPGLLEMRAQCLRATYDFAVCLMPPCLSP